ncbi:MAG TPA: hypothetical protein VGH28_22275 [Polyangiaceae bacterium]|jgi:hypothetical protein
MKHWCLALVAACAPAAAPHVEIATPLAHPVAPAPVLVEPMPADAAAVHSSASGDWARAFPLDRTFRALDLPPAARVLITWRVGASRALERLPDTQDVPWNHVSETSLVVRAAGAERTVALGELPGSPGPNEVSYCNHRGYRADAQVGWAYSKEPSIAAAFAMSIIQGSADFLLVRDGGTLHLLRRNSSDGSCAAAKQGPLDVCKGFEWSRVADVAVGEADLFERIDEGGGFDCGAEHWGERLVPP